MTPGGTGGRGVVRVGEGEGVGVGSGSFFTPFFFNLFWRLRKLVS